jgi:hypothetical protein
VFGKALLPGLVLEMPRVKKATKSHGRFTPFLRGVIYGLHLAGYAYHEIQEEVVKPDGSETTQQGIADAIAKADRNGGVLWDGEVGKSSGPPRQTTPSLDKQILRLVFKHRGRTSVTPKYIKKMIPAARAVSLRTLRRRLGEAGLAWLRRRRKSLGPEQHTEARMKFAEWVLSRTASTLSRWAFTDGTVFYLARTANELLDKRRGALGAMVWRQAGGSDALYEDCVGPSAYWKAQGTPVKILGLLAAGMLFIYVFPAGQSMNRWWYEWLINMMFPRCLAKAFGHHNVFLVQDHERCLWCDEPRQALHDQSIPLLTEYPKCSQDLNAIETAWREVRARLATTVPVDRETRSAFITRLRQAVAWVNTNRARYLQKLCTDQKQRARDVQKMEGARTEH